MSNVKINPNFERMSMVRTVGQMRDYAKEIKTGVSHPTSKSTGHKRM
jgi:hypothetical protein